jgi:hypothetical protein
MKYRLKKPFIIEGKRYVAGEEIELPKEKAIGLGPDAVEEVKEEKPKKEKK